MQWTALTSGQARVLHVLVWLGALGCITGAPAAAPPWVERARHQVEALHQEKTSRTPAQKKIDSQLLYALKESRGQPIAPGAPNLRATVAFEDDGRVLVDLRAVVNAGLIAQIEKGGGQVIVSVAGVQSLRALVPLTLVEALAARPEVAEIRPADQAANHSGSIVTLGDATHQAGIARTNLAVDGAGVRIGVLSDSVNYLSASQESGELPVVHVLPGQAGSGSGEGTAMLEIIHDLAPGAELYFATARNGEANFAQNILDLFAAGCRVIVDDVIYFRESPFQDGPIARAVREVCDQGALFFSSAGNSGNKNDGTSGTWEGDFLDGGPATIGRGGRWHDFGGDIGNQVLPGNGFLRVDLFWADPLGASTNDYDVYVLDQDGAVRRASTNVQEGEQDPYESLSALEVGSRLAIVKYSGADRYLYLSNGRGVLQYSTSGAVRGHNASGADNAFSVAAAWAGTVPEAFPGGSANPVERFSADGPRRMFFDTDGTPFTPDDFTSTGGVVLAKPDLTAADGVRTSVLHFDPFFGTSAAAPHAAAIAALVWSYLPSLSPAEVRAALVDSALDIEEIGADRDSGVGIVMALAALESARQPVPRLFFGAAELRDANENGVLDANECGQVFVSIRNIVSAIGPTAIGVTGRLRGTTPDILADPNPQSFPDIPPQGVATNLVPFTISTLPNFVCGQAADFELLLTTSNGLESAVRFTLPSIPSEKGSVVSFSAEDLPQPIADLSTTESRLTVPDLPLPLAKVTVSIHLLHTYDSDLELSLQSPSGTSVLLSFRNGGREDNYGLDCGVPVMFDDDALLGLESGSPPFVGMFRPDEPLSKFVGEYAGGPWTLRVRDLTEMDEGTLVCWSLNLQPILCQDGGGACLTPPAIVQQPADLLVTNGQPASFLAFAEGSPPLYYQWIYNQTNLLNDATNATLDLPAATPSQIGGYSLVVSNQYGQVTSREAQLLVVTPPEIISMPQDVVVTNGDIALLQVEAVGSPPLRYQWYFEGTVPLDGATNEVLILDSVSADLAGQYHVEVSNPYGIQISAPAILTVVTPPSIVSQPTDQTALVGSTVAFGVSAAGDEPLSYQWYFNETSIPEATQPSLTLTSVQLPQAGGYSVIVSNAYGIAASREAELIVLEPNDPPSVTLIRPEPGTSFLLGEPIVVEAAASDPDDEVGGVEFLVDGTPVLLLSQPPYSFEWNDATIGPAALQAVAFDARGARGTSTVVNITVDFTTNASVLVSTGSVWRYWDTGVAPDPEWVGIGFDDTAWASGPAELGYGEDDEATVVGYGPDPDNRYITTYFRHSFFLSDPGSFTNAELRLLRDDGAVVYLNGMEVFRSNMPEGPITFETLAPTPTAGPAEQTFFAESVDPAVFRSGWNVVAVEVHQDRPNTRDMSFNLELAGLRSLAPRILRQPSSFTVPPGTDLALSAEVAGAKPLDYRWFFNATQELAHATQPVLLLTNVQTDQTGSYTLVASNAFGAVTSQIAFLAVAPPGNLAPFVELISPSHGTQFEPGQAVSLVASASDEDGQVVQVEFYANGEILGTDPSAPYEFLWPDAAEGTYVLRAKAFDNAGAASWSVPVNILVGPGQILFQTLVSTGSVWKYLDTGVDQGTNWFVPDFDDAAWPEGPAELGYGDAVDGQPEATVLSFGSDPNHRYLTYYFRHEFTVSNAAGFQSLQVDLQRDDGAVVYLNGLEVFRSNMPQGEITFYTPANATVSGPDEILFERQSLDPAWLREGENLLAVEVHQINRVSSDLSFDLALSGDQLSPPLILVQPASLVVSNGEPASFQVSAVGAQPLQFQWYAGADAIMDATNDTLMFASVSPELEGDYQVRISNAAGSILSQPATLAVLVLPSNMPPTVQLVAPANEAVFSVHEIVPLAAEAFDPDGQVVRVEFEADGLMLGEATSAPYLFDWIGAEAGNHSLRAVAYDDRGGSNSSAAVFILVAPDLPPPELSRTLVAAGSAWRYLDTGVDQGTDWITLDFDDTEWPQGAAELGYGDEADGRPEATVLSYGPDATHKFSTYYFRQRFEATNAVQLSRVSLRIQRDDGVVAYLNGAEVFRDNLPEGPIDYATLAVTAVDKDQETEFLERTVPPTMILEGTNLLAVEIHQAAPDDSDVSFDLEMVGFQPTAPVIVMSPESVALMEGQSAQFTVLAAGSAPLFYQWYMNGLIALPDATNRTLVIPEVRLADQGSYAVTVTNSLGMAVSEQAFLRVLAPPFILTEPQSRSVELGTSTQFAVVASGTPPLHYQWRLNGTNDLPGTDSPTLLLENISLAQVGSYSVTVSNAVGLVQSQPAELRVLFSVEINNISVSEGVFQLSFESIVGLNYTCQYSDSFDHGGWLDLPGAIKLQGNGGLITVIDSDAAGTQRFYRVRVE